MNDILQLELRIVTLTKENADLKAKLDEATAWIKRDAELNPWESAVGMSWVEHYQNRNCLLATLKPPPPLVAAFKVWCEANGYPAHEESLRIFRGGADWAQAEEAEQRKKILANERSF